MSLRFPALPALLFMACLPGRAPAASDGFPQPTNNQAITDQALSSPEEVVRLMHLPPGFKATVFAAEPDVQNPIAMCWDERGRLWIAENYTYSDQKERFDLKLRDRILIFEDVDNDGRFDKRTVFADDLQMLTSIERGSGGVYALCPPNLLWIPAKDDQPAGPPQVLLDGFTANAPQRHTLANGLKWGPDGWLYGRVGITSTSWADVPGTPREKRLPTAGGIWRYHPTRRVYEPYCHGTTNPWGMDWNGQGEMFFINTVIGHLWHGIQGAHFKRMHGEDPYPNIYGLIDQHADHYHWDTGKKWNETRAATGLTGDLGGGHAHVGMMIYQGTNFPPPYRGKVFTTNLHGRRVNVDRLERDGSGYTARHEPDFMKSEDPWFRAVEIQYGPDGGVYILDWSDIGECHEDEGVHRTSGRIYKITYGDAVRPKETDLTVLGEDALVHLQTSDNEWLVRMARWELRERAIKGQSNASVLYALLELERTATGQARRNVRTAWLLLSGHAGEPDRASLPGKMSIVTPPDAGDGEAVVQFLKEGLFARPMRELSLTDEMEALTGKSDPAAMATARRMIGDWTGPRSTPRIRLTFSSALRYLPVKTRLQAAGALLSHAEDATDHNLPLMYWFGICDLPPVELVKLFKDCRIPLVRQFMARRLAGEMEKHPGPMKTMLLLAADSMSVEITSSVLKGMGAALKGWRNPKPPEGWDAFAIHVANLQDPALTQLLRAFGISFGSDPAQAEIRAAVLDRKGDVARRSAALRMLIEAKVPDLRPLCESLLRVDGLSLAAMEGLATFDDPALAEKIIARYSDLPPAEKPQAVALLASRPGFARVLLEHLEAKGDRSAVPRNEVTPVIARQIRRFNDAGLTEKLTTVWGEARESPEDKMQLMADLTAKLTPEVIGKGDARQGRILFNNICASCHKLYGEGMDIGPDLTGSGRHELNYLIENIADPSAVVAADYTMAVVTLKDGRVLSGILSAKTGRTVTIRMVGSELTVDRSDIAMQEQLPVSMMPEGLLMALNGGQISHLLSYLMSHQQVPLPE